APGPFSWLFSPLPTRTTAPDGMATFTLIGCEIAPASVEVELGAGGRRRAERSRLPESLPAGRRLWVVRPAIDSAARPSVEVVPDATGGAFAILRLTDRGWIDARIVARDGRVLAGATGSVEVVVRGDDLPRGTVWCPIAPDGHARIAGIPVGATLR